MPEPMELTEKFPEKKTRSKRLFVTKTRVLLHKNFLIFVRNTAATVIQLAFPIFICLYLSMIQVVVDEFAKTTVDPSPVVHEAEIPHCTGRNCISLDIVIAGESTDWTDFVIPHISQKSGFSIGKDIRVSQQSSLSFMESLSQNQNKTQVALILCTSQLDLQENIFLDSIPCQTFNSTGYFYSIVFNYTTALNQGYSSFKPHFFNKAAIGVKTAIDNAILAYEQSKKLSGNASISIETSYSSFPSAGNRYISNYDVATNQGPLYYFAPPMVLFGMIVAEIAREKEQKLRYGLTVTGVSHNEYWGSWLSIAFSSVFVASNVQIFAGYIFNFDFFLKTPYLILLLIFLVFGMSMMVIGFFLATLLPTSRSAYTVSYAFFLVGFVLQMFFSELYFIKFLFSEALPSWAKWVVHSLSLYPPFMFAVVVECVNAKSAYYTSRNTDLSANLQGYTWSDFVTPKNGHLRDNNYYSIPSGLSALTVIAMDALIFAALAWYFDHVIQGNRGKKYPLHFLFTKQYWKECKSQSNSVFLSKSDGLVLDGLEKVYTKGIFKKSYKQAVWPLHLNVSNDQLLALIGHNGAGKTTLMNMMTGLLAPTSGTAFINGLNLIKDFKSISKIIGYCPQYDILWEQLTAREHLRMFCQLKSVKHMDFTIESTLKQIGLEEDADFPVKGFSGGMKRRLSVGIASLGNPKIVFLDEPTTGMDPVSKKKVWRLVKELKQDKVVVLTTHSMEEADILSDIIAVMVDGSIDIVGSSLSLKNQYGNGYKISIVSSNPRECWSKIKANHPHVHLIDLSAGSLLISLSKNYPKETEILLEDLEENRYRGLVEEWSLSNSSLEEVFMKLTNKKFNTPH